MTLRPGTAPTAVTVTWTTGARELVGTRLAMTAGPAAAQLRITAAARLADTRLDVGEAEAREGELE